jgi:PAS domain S-box-containing protein|tara:strand:- start:8172 stop:9893 length:1722 start_codon:yes stop_codon:yes gene_type:complete
MSGDKVTPERMTELQLLRAENLALRNENAELKRANPTDQSEFQSHVQQADLTSASESDLAAPFSSRPGSDTGKSGIRFRDLIETSQDIIWRTDANGRFTYLNSVVKQVLGFDVDEMLGHHYTNFVNLDEPQTILAAYRDASDGREIEDHETTYVSKAGKNVILRFRAMRIADPDARIVEYQGTAHDVTAQKIAEEELIQAQKMEAMGILAGGIAHDFNNILAGIQGYAELSQILVPEDHPATQSLAEILAATDRAVALIKQILAYSRKTPSAKIVVPMASLVDEAMHFMRSTLPASIRVELASDVTDGRVLVDPTQIHQVIMNLCANAAAAMPDDEGVLKLTVDSVDLGEDDHTLLKPGAYVRMTVRDNGTGIKPATLNRIFDPYFTTKDVGKGTGLGLAVVRSIITEHEGDISVESTLGKGTTFTVLLRENKELHRETRILASHRLPQGSEKILFVDDEAAVTRAYKHLLDELGYKVTVSNSSMQALKMFEADPDGFDMLLTDQTMPGMNGDRLASSVLKIRPNLPVILCTGFSATIDEVQAESLGIRAFLSKPVSQADMHSTIRSIFDSPR